MKFASFLLLAGGLLSAIPAHAQCTDNRLNRTQLDLLLQPAATTMVLVCGRPDTGYAGNAADRWQEEHNNGGAYGVTTPLFDFKLGGGIVDPRVQVGTWRNDGTGNGATVIHTYGSTSYTWSVHGPNSNTAGTSIYYFCSGTSPVVRAYVRPNVTTGCGGTFPP